METQRSSEKHGLLRADEVTDGRRRVRIPSGTFNAGAAPSADAGAASIKLDTDDSGTVRTVTVSCPCGRTHVLKCEYPKGK